MSTPRPCRPFPTRSLVAASIAVVGGIVIASLDRSIDFTPYFGSLPPLLAGTIVCSIGIAVLRLLQEHAGFCVKRPEIGLQKWLTAIGLAVPFMVTVTVADLLLEFPPDINVRFPSSLLFYPAMGFVAQIALHVVPFALFLFAFKRLFGALSSQLRVWLSIGLASLPEAAFQISGVAYAQAQTLTVFVAAQLFVFGLIELYLFRRFDFVCMYVFRLTYYGYWHVLWGYLRA